MDLNMVFESLSDKLNSVFKRLRNKGRLTEGDVKEVMREIRMVLLEADVNIKVVKEFISRVSVRANGADVLESLTPAQQVIKIVKEELTLIMGEENSKIKFSNRPPTVVMMVGLQGSGKTTHTAKLANYYRKMGKRPLMVACDVYRPAAIKQLEVLGAQLGIPVFSLGDKEKPENIAKAAVIHANQHGNDLVFLDTAGRLHIDEELMDELSRIKSAVNPTEILLVIDAMIGQDSVNVAERFDELLNIDGVILSKLDGDTRGGAALSIRHITGKPIKFMGTGEKLSDLEPFHPDRMVSRILGMGDVLSLIEKAETAFDEKEAAKLEEKMRTSTLNLEDFLQQMKQVRKMGPLDKILGMLPGVNAEAMKNIQIDEKQIDRVEAIILSMTIAERRRPDLLNAARRKRIAAGSGTKVEDINRLIKQFEQTQKMMKQMAGGGMGGMGGKSKAKSKKHR